MDFVHGMYFSKKKLKNACLHNCKYGDSLIRYVKGGFIKYFNDLEVPTKGCFVKYCNR